MTDEIDQRYRRAAEQDPSRPSEAVSRAVLAHAAALAAERTAARDRELGARARRRWWPGAWGGLAAAGLAGLLLLPRLWELPHSAQTPHPASGATPFPGSAPLSAAPPTAAPPTAAQPPRAVASQSALAPAPAPPAADLGAAARRSEPRSQASAAATPSPTRDAFARSVRQTEAQLQAPPHASIDPAAALRDAAAGGDVARLRALLDAHADIGGRDAAGRTALLLAVMQGHSEAVELLLARGADPNAADFHGTRPLGVALAARRGDLAAALRQAGAH